MHPHASTFANQIHFAIANTLLYPSLLPLLVLSSLELRRREFFRTCLIHGLLPQSDQEFNDAFEEFLKQEMQIKR